MALTLLPVVLAKLGPRLDWPHVRNDDKASRSWTSWAELVVRRRWVAALGASLVLAALVLAATNLQLGISNVNTIAKEGDAKQGLVALERSGIGSGALVPHEVLVNGPSSPRAWPRALATVAGVHGAVAPEPAGVAARGRGDSRCVRHRRRLDIRGSRDARPRPLGRARRPVRASTSAGNRAQNSDFIEAVYGNFPLMIALIALITFVLLARAFRSLLLPLKAVVLNVISVGAAWGVLEIVWQRGHGSNLIWGIPATGSITAWIPLMVFAFLFGLSMDYEVFILARMREEYDRTGSTDDGGDPWHRAHRATGDERRPDPVPCVRLARVRPGDRNQSPGDGPGRRHPARRDRDPRAVRARGDVAVRALELVAAADARTTAARRALPGPMPASQRTATEVAA